MDSKVAVEDEKLKRNHEICNVCGSCYDKSNRARHLKSKRHNEVDYINNNRFEIQRIAPQKEPKNEIIIIK